MPKRLRASSTGNHDNHDSWKKNYSDATFSLARKNPHFASGEDGFVESAPVGSFPARRGLHDLLGNVSEWVERPEFPEDSQKTYVGSNWATMGNARDIAPKKTPDAAYQSARIGFRLVLVE